ncbi:MAG: MmcQ/YjbR family DNA-binding protein [Clostridia bacterium]|nr:MmcQ/YjbR family DNA-binding protein [Clostridia bacterium]
MDRKELETFIFNAYDASPEYLWEIYPTCAVFRHKGNRKWFAVIMTVSKSKLGIKDDGKIDIVNVKCADEIIDSMWQERGIYPAYHMSKSHWLSVSLDGSVEKDTVEWLLDISYGLTKPKIKKRKENKNGI